MRELGIDRLDDDGRLLILVDTISGEEFSAIASDAADLLRSRHITRSDSRTETPVTTPSLNPREIQTRIRRGESPDEVAHAAGVELARIEAFAAPVVAEREYMAQQARKTTIRRRHSGGSGTPLGVVVDDHVSELGIAADSVVWDAWRREDGRWTVTAIAPSAQPATFIYDIQGRYVVPEDAAAHQLIGDVALPEHTDMAIADAVREQRSAELEPTQADVDPTTNAPATDEAAVESTSPGDDVSPIDVADAAPVDAGDGASVRYLHEARDRRAAEQEALAKDDPIQPSFDELDLFSEQPEVEADDVAVNEGAAHRKKKNERRRVPSWDEIMFGGRDD